LSLLCESIGTLASRYPWALRSAFRLPLSARSRASAASPQGRPELQDIVRGADQRPFAPHLSQPAQQELQEATSLLDLPEHQLHDGLAPSIQTPPALGKFQDRCRVRLNP